MIAMRQVLAGLAVGALLGALSAPAAAQDAVAGKKAFNQQCRVCHQVVLGAGGDMGPSLLGVVGRAAASDPGFTYSAALKAEADKGLVLSEAKLDVFLTEPAKMIPGTTMPVSVASAPTRADIIAYLASLKP